MKFLKITTLIILFCLVSCEKNPTRRSTRPTVQTFTYSTRRFHQSHNIKSFIKNSEKESMNSYKKLVSTLFFFGITFNTNDLLMHSGNSFS